MPDTLLAHDITAARNALAAALVRTAWDRTDYLGDLVPYSIRYRQQIAEAIDTAANILHDEGAPEPDDYTLQRARLLLEVETDEWLERCEREPAQALADAVEAGDCRPDGEVIPYEKYRAV